MEVLIIQEPNQHRGYWRRYGIVHIYQANESIKIPKKILNSTDGCNRNFAVDLEQALDRGWQPPEEVTKAREAATPGKHVNNWPARKIQPRNLPGSVNEYGFGFIHNLGSLDHQRIKGKGSKEALEAEKNQKR